MPEEDYEQMHQAMKERPKPKGYPRKAVMRKLTEEERRVIAQWDEEEGDPNPEEEGWEAPF